LSFINEIL